MTLSIPCHLLTGSLGLLMGFGLSRMGFSEFGEVHRMFTFDDLRLTFSFAAAVVLVGVGFLGLSAPRRHAPRHIHPGTVPGGLLFGAGWALCGACPAIAWVQLGEGRLLALASIAGILLGTALYPKVHARFFRWPSESCQG